MLIYVMPTKPFNIRLALVAFPLLMFQDSISMTPQGIFMYAFLMTHVLWIMFYNLSSSLYFLGMFLLSALLFPDDILDIAISIYLVQISIWIMHSFCLADYHKQGAELRNEIQTLRNDEGSMAHALWWMATGQIVRKGQWKHSPLNLLYKR